MRELNFRSVPSNRAAVSITTTLYDRRALDCTADRPLVNSLNHLTYLASSSARVRETLCVDGGLERLVAILKECRDDFHSNDDDISSRASKEQVMLTAWKWTLALQCLVFLGTRGTEQIRGRVVDAGLIPVITTILDNYLFTLEKNKSNQKARVGNLVMKSDIGGRRYVSGHSTAAAALGTAALGEDTPVPAIPAIPAIPANNPFSNHLRPVTSNASTDSIASSSASSVFSLASMSSSVSSVSSLDSFDSRNEPVAAPQNIPYYQQQEQQQFQLNQQQQQFQQNSRSQQLNSISPIPNDRRPMSTSATIDSSFAQNVLVTAAASLPANSLRINQPNPRLPPLHSQASNAVFHTHARASPVASLQTPITQPHGHHHHHHRHNHNHNHDHHNSNMSSTSDDMRSVSPEASSNIGEDNEEYDSSSTITTTATLPVTNPTLSTTAIVDPESLGEDENPLSSWTDIVLRPQQEPGQQQQQLEQQQQQQQMPLQLQLQLQQQQQQQFQLPFRPTQGAVQAATSVTRGDLNPTVTVNTTPATSTTTTITSPSQTDPTSRGTSVNTSVASAVSAVPRQFRDHVIITREEDIIWALEILAFVSKYAYLKPSLQNSHLVPKLSVRDATKPPLVKASSYSISTQPSQRSAESSMGGFDQMDIDDEPELDKSSPPPSSESSESYDYDEYDFEVEKDIDPEFLGETMNIFPLVEKFTVKQFPKEIQYWAGVIMRNSCRRNESLGGIRQCANFECGRWEEYPRQFAKCRRCKRTKYCSKECQLQAWNFHRHWCVQSGAGSSTSSGSSSSRHQHGSNTASSHSVRTGSTLAPHQQPTQTQTSRSLTTAVEPTTTNS